MDEGKISNPLRSWVISEGHAGMENQALGLAERLGLEPEIKRVKPTAPWIWLPSGWWPAPLWALGPDSDEIAAPWPDLLISSGRRSVPYSIHIGRQAGPGCIRIHIQNPQCALRHFDLIATPLHDHLTGKNVVGTLGALHRVTPKRLALEAEKFRPLLSHLPRPLVAVLIGGNSRTYQLTTEIMAKMCDQLGNWASEQGVGLAITPSRRTGAENIGMLKQRLTGGNTFIWDFEGENPYFGLLGLADYIVVTSDSVSMLSEAMSTGKPIYVIDLEGGSRKFDEFHQSVRARGITRPIGGKLESWHYDSIDETARVAEIIRQKINARDK
jgi:mitochondrial fission protein ELM1